MSFSYQQKKAIKSALSSLASLTVSGVAIYALRPFSWLKAGAVIAILFGAFSSLCGGVLFSLEYSVAALATALAAAGSSMIVFGTGLFAQAYGHGFWDWTGGGMAVVCVVGIPYAFGLWTYVKKRWKSFRAPPPGK